MKNIWTIAASLQISAASCSFIASSSLVFVILRKTFGRPSAGESQSSRRTKEQQVVNHKRTKNSPGSASGHQQRNAARDLKNSAYKRIIFCICASDMLQSLSLILGPFASTISPWTLSNQRFCSFDGILFVVGMTCVPYYSTVLSIYYYCKLYKNMTEDEILHKVEQKMHMFIFPFVILMNVYALAANSVNSATSGTVCTYATTPTGCKLMDGVECDDNMIPALVLNIITVFIIPFASLAIIVSVLSFLLWKIIWQERILPPRSALDDNVPKQEDDDEETKPTSSEVPQTLRENGNKRNKLPANSYRKEMMWQLISYSVVFILTYILYSIAVLQIFLKKQPHIAIYFIVQFCIPLQGLFNILIFNRPDARVIKYKYPSLSWSRAFWLVFIHGGDSASITEEEIGIVDRSKEDQDAEKLEAEINEVIDAAANNVGQSFLQCDDHGRFNLLSDIPEDSTIPNKKNRTKKEYVAYKDVIVPF